MSSPTAANSSTQSWTFLAGHPALQPQARSVRKRSKPARGYPRRPHATGGADPVTVTTRPQTQTPGVHSALPYTCVPFRILIMPFILPSAIHTHRSHPCRTVWYRLLHPSNLWVHVSNLRRTGPIPSTRTQRKRTFPTLCTIRAPPLPRC